ncbi:SRPBCC family protein [Flexivirga meconopsidis]|uniref:SRPBCC family protein n=1 Tax=Flexivirga meconopsidis TaxID=2977121 RepID=UPI002240DEA6|nr:SRPBCC domain-containing protein [Flexivirga meconopsidis]
MITNNDFTTTFVAPVTPDEAFEASTAPRTWWNQMIVGAAAQIGDTFIFDVPGLHHSKFEVTEARPGQHLAWKVIPSGEDTELDEWLDTVVTFDFAPDTAGTRVTFTHHGLQPRMECHDVCSTAWAYHLDAGLRALLTEGQGTPITPDTIDEVARKVGAAAE